MRVGIWFGVLLLFLAGSEVEKERTRLRTPIPFLTGEGELTRDLLAEMSLAEKAGQLFILRSGPGRDSAVLDAVAGGRAGGLLLEGLEVEAFLALSDSSRRSSRLPLLMATRQKVLLNDQFADAYPGPSLASLQSVASDPLRAEIVTAYHRQLRQMGINLVMGPEASALGLSRLNGTYSSLHTLQQLHADRILGAADDLRVLPADTVSVRPDPDDPMGALLHGGVSALLVDPVVLRQTPVNSDPGWLADRLRRVWGFQGLLIMELAAGEDPVPPLRAGVDLLITPDAALSLDQVTAALRRGELDIRGLETKVAKTLRAKQWMREGLTPPVQEEDLAPLQASLAPVARQRAPRPAPAPDSLLAAGFGSERWDYLSYKMYENSVVLAHNRRRALPFGRLHGRNFRLLHFSDHPFQDFQDYFQRYSDVFSTLQPPAEDGTLPPVDEAVTSGWTHVVLLESEGVQWTRDLPFIQSVRELARREQVVLINFGNPDNLQHFDTTLTAIQIFDRNEITEATAAQVLFGALEAKGRLPVTVNDFFPAGAANRTPVIRLKYGRPEEVGIAPERLVGIDAIARTAVEERATPGCQVVVAKDGKIIYHKAFGYHDYARLQEVNERDLYDLASITKVAATTLGAMTLYERDKLEVDARLGDLLGLDGDSELNRIPLKKLMTHQSGLQPHMPTLPYLLYRDEANAECDSFFCKDPNWPYSVQIAESFYFDKRYQDSIWTEVQGLEVGSQRRYRYSDVNFVLLQRVLEEQSGYSLADLVRHRFYAPLGLRRTTFRPLERFSRRDIVPTQLDDRWRHQLVHGYVHDETAAIFGGVAGHAGLFSTAEELTVLFQMLLNGGVYGGQRVLQPETIEYFTSARHGNHRGLGFNKPSDRYRSGVAYDAPLSTYGHTGFTGTCAWADPDNDLVFVFLSNRIHPDVRNRKLFKDRVRERIHQVVYDALGTYHGKQKEEKPALKGG